MAKIRPADWSSTSAYAVGAEVYYSGLLYECVTAISAGNNAIPVDNTSWKLLGFWDVQDFYSLQEGILEYANSDDTIFVNSLPRFIQRAHDDIASVIRSPGMLVTREFTVDGESSFRLSSDVLEIDHIRRDGDASGAATLEQKGYIEIKPAQDETEWQTLRQYYNRDFGNPGSILDAYKFPRYIIRNSRVYITGPNLPENTTVIVTYYQNPPKLGQTYNRIDQETGAALNSAGQTLAQWTAAGNSAGSFVQGTIGPVTSNYFVQAFPNLVLLGALSSAEVYLNDNPRIQQIKEEYKQMLNETIEKIEEFKQNNSNSPIATVDLLS